MRKKVKIGIGAVSLVIFLIVVGIAVSMYPVYQSAQGLEVINQDLSQLNSSSGTEIDVESVMEFSNPGRGIEIQEMSYEVHAEEDMLGKGSKKDFMIEQGNSSEKFNFTIDLENVDQSTKQSFLQGPQEVTFKIEVTVPIKWFDLVTVTTYTVPFNYTKEVELSSLQGQLPSF